jgi:N-glycosylase/DNA lyase
LETVVSFIISANNNIPRIKGIINRICERLGEEKDGYRAFPTAERLLSADEALFRELGAGYRAAYLVKAAKCLRDARLYELQNLGTKEARKRLLGICGVGRKVADCILLFSFKKTDIFPVDTWSKKIYNMLGMIKTDCASTMSENLVGRFGPLSGYAQQYLYYYYRTGLKS